MLKILYIQGTIDGTFPLDPTELTGDAVADRSLAYVTKFKAGSIVKIGADGYIALAADKDLGVGILVNDAAGYDFENIPALASGMAPAIIGGCVVALGGGALLDPDNRKYAEENGYDRIAWTTGDLPCTHTRTV